MYKIIYTKRDKKSTNKRERQTKEKGTNIKRYKGE